MRTFAIVLFVAAGLSLPSRTAAQSVDSRWAPWMGCWDLLTQQAPPRPPGTAPPPSVRPARPTAEGERPRVCVEPRANGVVLRTFVADQPMLEQVIVADGTSRPITEAACRGTERAEWSRDGRRLFSRAELACTGQPSRTVSGITLLGPDGTWIDTQAVSIGGRENVRVRHFRRPSGQASDSPVDTRPLTVDDVIEASRAVAPGALEAALIETRARFALSGRTLVALDDAGVPGSVTDLMVAVSYPRAFAVERTGRDDRLASFDTFPYADSWAYGLPSYWGADPYFFSPYYFSPFGFSYLGLYPQAFGSGVSFIGGDAGDGPPRDAGQGRVIDGRGYTRVRPRDAAQGAGSTGSDGSGTASTSASTPRRGGTVTSRGYTGDSSGGGQSGGASSGASGSSGGSTQSSGGGSGRTAMPR